MVDPYVICTKVMRDFRSSLKTPLRSKTSPIKLYRGSAIASLLDLKRGILFWRFTACVYEYVRTSDLPIQASERYKMEPLYSELGSQALYASHKAVTKVENQEAISST